MDCSLEPPLKVVWPCGTATPPSITALQLSSTPPLPGAHMPGGQTVLHETLSTATSYLYDLHAFYLSCGSPFSPSPSPPTYMHIRSISHFPPNCDSPGPSDVATSSPAPLNTASPPPPSPPPPHPPSSPTPSPWQLS